MDRDSTPPDDGVGPQAPDSPEKDHCWAYDLAVEVVAHSPDIATESRKDLLGEEGRPGLMPRTRKALCRLLPKMFRELGLVIPSNPRPNEEDHCRYARKQIALLMDQFRNQPDDLIALVGQNLAQEVRIAGVG